MKIYRLILIIALGVFTMNSCSDKDLELVNPNELSPETYFANEAQVAASVNAVYANLNTNPLYGRLIWYMMDNMSHEQGGNAQQEADKVTFYDFSFDSSNDQIANFWESCYRGINKANFVLGNIDRINELSEAELSTTRKNKYIAEARFLRAHYYWLLVNRFGGIPLLDENTAPGGTPISPKSDIIALIIEDLKFAKANLLPKAEEENGRATKGAAQAFLGKVLLYEKQYGPALDEFKAMSGYDLEADYYDNFKEETEYGIESVFEIAYDLTLGTDDKWGGVEGTGKTHGNLRGQDYGNLDWFNVYPSEDLLAEFEPGDKRFAASFYVIGDTYLNGTKTMEEKNFKENGGNIRPAAWKKYQNYYKQASENQESGINVKVIRYADVLLMMAECANEAETPADAIPYINRVRARAGVPALATTLSKEQVFEAIVHERKVELAGEQVRFDDLLRWGRAATFLAGSNFQVGKNELWPIPDREIASNPNVSPADQNPGY